MRNRVALRSLALSQSKQWASAGCASVSRLALTILLLMPCSPLSLPSAFARSQGAEAGYAELSSDASAMLLNADFARLDAMAEEMRRRKARFADGLWKLAALYAGMRPLRDGEPAAA